MLAAFSASLTYDNAVNEYKTWVVGLRLEDGRCLPLYGMFKMKFTCKSERLKIDAYKPTEFSLTWDTSLIAS